MDSESLLNAPTSSDLQLKVMPDHLLVNNPNGQYPPFSSVTQPPSDYRLPVMMQPVVGSSEYTPYDVNLILSQGDSWIPRPPYLICTPGLEYLSLIDQLIVEQQIELAEVLFGFETKNNYTIKNSMGQKIYTAKEDTDCCTRNSLGPSRPFDMKIEDNSENEIIHLYRPFRCNSCLFPCCLQEMEVMAPPGTFIGSITQEWSICRPKFSVQNAARDTVLYIEGPVCTFSICGDVEFKILSKDKSVKVGKITKQWSGLFQEVFTDADNFGISFPVDLDVNMKAVMLGACFLIDFMFFEKQK